MKIINVLEEFLKEVEEENPFNLVLKGGTALAIYYLDHHRESEDLDFDTEKHHIKDYERIKEYFNKILHKLKERKVIDSYNIAKSGFASTNRYHIKLELKTYKMFYSKIDVDFVDLPENLIKNKKLNLYHPERLFVTKAVTFISRKEFKDLYDIFFLIKKIDVKNFKNKEPVIKLIQDLIININQEDIKKLFHIAFRNVDLKFKDLKESQLERFMQDLIQQLRLVINKLKK